MAAVLNKHIPPEINIYEKHTVVWFSNLSGCANNLGLALGQKDIFQYNAVGKKIKEHGGKYIWLVGHGEKDETGILKVGGGEIVNIVDIAKMFEDNGAICLIDTCCAPAARKAAIQASRLTINYYCIEDEAAITTQLSLAKDKSTWLTDFDTWWGANKFKKMHPKAPIAPAKGTTP